MRKFDTRVTFMYVEICFNQISADVIKKKLINNNYSLYYYSTEMAVDTYQRCNLCGMWNVNNDKILFKCPLKLD